MEGRTRLVRRRGRPDPHRLPLPARHVEVEQDRASAVQARAEQTTTTCAAAGALPPPDAVPYAAAIELRRHRQRGGRRQLGTTNAIESLNARYRRAAQACGHFPMRPPPSHASLPRPPRPCTPPAAVVGAGTTT
ncbi:transposase [Streptomyces sp. ACA25]|uniref:transposase n=1 Tax=Streptomyces sp. ACA25 TaxID=3022596 RepID=UPI003FA6E5F5